MSGERNSPSAPPVCLCLQGGKKDSHELWYNKNMYRQYYSDNKYNAKKTVAKDGIKRDSKFEASVADELYLRKRAGDIKDYDSQFKVEMWAYDKYGKPAIKMSHKVDFRIHHNDGSYELLEAKGVETADYRLRRKWLEKLWLPENLDYTYTVVKQRTFKKYR